MRRPKKARGPRAGIEALLDKQAGTLEIMSTLPDGPLMTWYGYAASLLRQAAGLVRLARERQHLLWGTAEKRRQWTRTRRRT